MKNIQISFDENILDEVDKVASLTKTSRSAIIRDAIKYWLREKDIKDFNGLEYEFNMPQILFRDDAVFGKAYQYFERRLFRLR